MTEAGYIIVSLAILYVIRELSLRYFDHIESIHQKEKE